MQHLRHLGADDDHRIALRGQLPQQFVDLGFAAHVDTARGFVHDQHIGMHRQPFADDDLLLIAAGQVAHLLPPAGGADVEPVAILIKDRDFRAFGHKRSGLQVIHLWQGHVVATVHAQHQTLTFAVLRHQRDAHIDGLHRGGDPHLAPIEQDLPGGRVAQAKERLGNLCATRAHQTVKAQNLAPAHLKAHVVKQLAAAEAPHL